VLTNAVRTGRTITATLFREYSVEPPPPAAEKAIQLLFGVSLAQQWEWSFEEHADHACAAGGAVAAMRGGRGTDVDWFAFDTTCKELRNGSMRSVDQEQPLVATVTAVAYRIFFRVIFNATT
jgi:hypothetical protein